MTSLLLPKHRNQRPPSPFRSTLGPIYSLKLFSRKHKIDDEISSSCCSTASDDDTNSNNGNDDKDKQVVSSASTTDQQLSIIPHSRRARHLHRSITIDNPTQVLTLMRRLQVLEREALWFAKLIRRESLRRIHVGNAMNYVMSVGGGWASVKNSKKAMECSRILALLAASIGDEVTVRRCLVFEGYALMWEGKHNKKSRKAALKIFARVKELAALSGDVENGVRCEHGMKNLLWDFDADTAAADKNDKKIEKNDEQQKQ